MDEPAVTHQPALTRTCIECNYALDGLPGKGRCPECGLDYGDELVLVGYRSVPIAKTTAITSLVILIGLAFTFFFTDNVVKGAITLGVSVWFLFTYVLGRQSHDTLGGDLRWIVNHEGIRVIRGHQTKIPLLPWSQIRVISKAGNLGMRTPGWRTLVARRNIFSLDWFRTRGQQIWLEKIEPESLTELRDKVRSYRP